MKQNEKYAELDKQVSKEIMQKLKGSTTECICPYCKGHRYYEIYHQDGSCQHEPCEECKGKGTLEYEW